MSADLPDVASQHSSRRALYIILAVFFLVGLIFTAVTTISLFTAGPRNDSFSQGRMRQFLKGSHDAVLNRKVKNGAWPNSLPSMINHDGSPLKRIDLRDSGERPLLYRIPTPSSRPTDVLIHTDPAGPRPILSITIDGQVKDFAGPEELRQALFEETIQPPTPANLSP